MSVSKIASFNDLIYMLGITFFCVGIAHLGADYIGPLVTEILNSIENQTAARLMVSFGNGFFWLVVLSTLFGVGLSFTKYREFEGVGASKMGSLFLYVLVATIGMKMDIMELIANWGVFKFLLSIGLIWIMVHALFLFIVAKIIKAPFFYVAVGSQANVGGAASAPIVASAFSPSLAPVGVLLAVLGYAVGTFGYFMHLNDANIIDIKLYDLVKSPNSFTYERFYFLAELQRPKSPPIEFFELATITK